MLVIHQSDELLGQMDAWNKGTHGCTGLIEKSQSLGKSLKSRHKSKFCSFKALHPQGQSATVRQQHWPDRRFWRRCMPSWKRFSLPQHWISTLKELSKRWKPAAYSSFKKAQKHTALADVLESIDELAHYRAQLFAL